MLRLLLQNKNKKSPSLHPQAQAWWLTNHPQHLQRRPKTPLITLQTLISVKLTCAVSLKLETTTQTTHEWTSITGTDSPHLRYQTAEAEHRRHRL